MEPFFRQIAIDAEGSTIFGAAAAAHWPPELLPVLERARLIQAAPASKVQICPGCSRACVMEVRFIAGAGFIQCNQDIDYGLIELDPAELRIWRASRSRVVAFVARELNLSPTDRHDRAVHVRFGTWRRASVRRAVALEFTDSVVLRVGDAEAELSGLLKLQGERLHIDEDELQIRASQSADPQLGGKRYLHSRLKQHHRAGITALRNLRLQDAADQLKSQIPGMKKADIAKAIVASGSFGPMSPATVTRIIRIPNKSKRKKFA